MFITNILYTYYDFLFVSISYLFTNVFSKQKSTTFMECVRSNNIDKLLSNN